MKNRVEFEEFERLLHELGWRGSAFGRRFGVHRNTVTNWRKKGWVPVGVMSYLELKLAVRRLGE